MKPSTFPLITLLFYVFLFPTAVNGQGIVTAPDTALAKAYYQKAKILYDSVSYDSAVFYYKKAADVYEHVGIWNMHVSCYNSIATCLMEQAKYERARKYLIEALSTGLKQFGEQDTGIAISYNNLGLNYYYQGDYTSAIHHYQKALKIYLEFFNEHSVDIGICYGNVGNAYYAQGDYKQALVFFYKALELHLKNQVKDQTYIALMYNNLGVIYHAQGNYAEAILHFKKALVIQLEVLGAKHPDIAVSYNNIGVNYQVKNDYEQAAFYLKKALTIRKELLGENHPDIAINYSNIGTVYEEEGDYWNAINHYQKALAIWLEVYGKEHILMAPAYNGLGVTYSMLGDYQKAIGFIKKALNIRKEVLGPDHPDVAYSHFCLGRVFESQHNYTEALNHSKEALRIQSKVYGEVHITIALSYANIGSVYHSSNNYEEALYYYKKALAIQQKIFGEYHNSIAANYNNIANVYKDLEDYEQAIDYLDKARLVQYKIFDRHHPHLAANYRNTGSLYQVRQAIDKALYYYQKSIRTLVADFNETDIRQNPKLENIRSERYLLGSLRLKASTLKQRYAQESQNLQDLRLSVSTYRLATQLIDQMKKSYRAEASKLFLAGESQGVYREAIATSLQLYEKTKEDSIQEAAFTFAEKNKAGLLLEAIQESHARRFAGIPDSLLEQEHELRVNLNYYDSEIQKRTLEKGSYDTTLVQAFESRFFDLSREYETLVEQFERDYPDYYRLKYDLTVASVADVQQYLPDEQTTLLEYAIGDSGIFIFQITKGSYRVHEVSKPKDFEQQVRDFRAQVTDFDRFRFSEPEKRQVLFEAYLSLGHNLYKTLLQPIVGSTAEVLSMTAGKESEQRLIIVPDGILGYLPFEALLTEKVKAEKVNFVDLPYLIRRCQTFYAYSATLLTNRKASAATRKSPGKLFAGFAPDYPILADTIDREELALLVREDFYPLENNEKEVRQIAALFKGDVFTGKAASERLFREKAGQYRLLHLAMHTRVRDQHPLHSSLVFRQSSDSLYDNFLEVSELYGMELNARLAVLSACKTGYGQWVRGEGVMSLSRAFAYAGCPSLVMSLWNAEDQSTAAIMVDFYKELKKGQSIDGALRQAKLNTLDNYSHDYYGSHPFFWAAFVPVGEMGTVDIPSTSYNWLWWGGGCLLLFVLLVLFVRFLRKV